MVFISDDNWDISMTTEQTSSTDDNHEKKLKLWKKLIVFLYFKSTHFLFGHCLFSLAFHTFITLLVSIVIADDITDMFNL